MSSLLRRRTARALLWSVLAAPPLRARVPIQRTGPLPTLRPQQPLTLLLWNVQFAAGRDQIFFYDGGSAVHVAPDVVVRSLDRIGEVLRELDADLVLLQEVDRSSDRTGRIDQLAALLQRAPYPLHLSAPYHRSPYIPFPAHQHLGRMDMHLAVLSRVQLQEAIRHQLPALHEPWLRRQFNLRRALLELRLPRQRAGPLAVLETHLSAFSRGDGTLPRQVAALVRHLCRLDREAVPWVLGGDFNALPPGDDPARLGAAAGLYPEIVSPISVLFDRWRPAISASAHRSDPQRWRTWLPPGEPLAERALDHAFTSDGLEVLEVEVLHRFDDISDHLPIRLVVRIP